MVKNVTIDKDVNIKAFYIPSDYEKYIFKYNPEIDKYKEVGEYVEFVITIILLSNDEIKININNETAGFHQALPYINFIKLENNFTLIDRHNSVVTTKNKEIINIVNSRVDLILFLDFIY